MTVTYVRLFCDYSCWRLVLIRVMLGVELFNVIVDPDIFSLPAS
jgi:hypothetical protein